MKDSEIALQEPGKTSLRFREATDVAAVCREIAESTAVTIGEKKYVIVEAWTSIAVAHGCIATIKEGSVQEVFRDGKLIGIKAVAEIRRQSDGHMLSSAEGFVGDDEEDWFGSHGETVLRWNKYKKQEVPMIIPKREDYAIRSMAQTRAISRACRTAFAHVVVMMKAGLSTTPAEEMPDPNRDVVETTATDAGKEKKNEGHPDLDRQEPPPSGAKAPVASKPAATASQPISVPRDDVTKLEKQFEDRKWEKVKIHFGNTNRGVELGQLELGQLQWYCFTWSGSWGDKPPSLDDKILRAACNVAIRENNLKEPAPRR